MLEQCDTKALKLKKAGAGIEFCGIYSIIIFISPGVRTRKDSISSCSIFASDFRLQRALA